MKTHSFYLFVKGTFHLIEYVLLVIQLYKFPYFNSLVKISMMSFIAFCIKSIIIVKRKLPSGLKI